MNPKCQPFRELLPAYALQALDPGEIRTLESHLCDCPDCRADLDDYRRVSEGLLFALPPKVPPPRVRAQLIARLGGRTSAGTSSLPKTLRGRFGVLWRLAGGLALVALLALNVSTLTQMQAMQRQQLTLARQLETSQTALAIVAYGEGRTLEVQGPKAGGTLILDSELQSGVLFAWGLDVLNESQAYQVWLIQPDGQRVSGGLFRAEPGQQFVSVVIPSQRPFSDFTGMGVTVEPRGGSPGPTGPKVLGTSF